MEGSTIGSLNGKKKEIFKYVKNKKNKPAGTTVKAKIRGQRSGVPKMNESPRICDSKMEIVTINW
jgi:hypothetical protein